MSTNFQLQNIILPLGISFFTFQQISYLFDIYTEKHDPSHEGFISYCCYICFFPQLIAGPIVHHHEMMPQFFCAHNHTIQWKNIYNALKLLIFGLSKKILIADNLSPIVHECFDNIGSMTFFEAIVANLSYTLQLYFDFSGYCDIAIACALFFNIKLPLNFDSPYKSKSIQEFWRRWHITLSRWLRDYIYIPLGGNRKGKLKTYSNIFITFLIGGLWHGAAWTFVIWGALHGVALVINRLWSDLKVYKLPNVISIVLTFSFINIAWIFFRCNSFERVSKFYEALFFMNGILVRESTKPLVIHKSIFPTFDIYCIFLAVLLYVIFFCKNSLTLYRVSNSKIHHICVVLFSVVVFFLLIPDKPTEFIYSQF